MTAGDQPIPRIIHRLWLGPDAIPEAFERYGETWRRHHPAWEVRLWRDDDLPALANQTVLDHTRSFKARYDMVRYELLRQQGGVIVDLDMECLRPLDPLLGGVRAFVGRETGKERRVGTQIIGAVAGHPLLEAAVARLADGGGDRTANQVAGPVFLTRVVDDFRDEITIFPRETFLSARTIEPPRRPGDFPEIYAVHHHAESWRGSGVEAELTRLEKRLALAQDEIDRLLRLEDQLERTRTQLDKARAQRDAALESRWWRLGRRLGVLRLG
jgi:mannosyltransferase OCH1-like enzyme